MRDESIGNKEKVPFAPHLDLLKPKVGKKASQKKGHFFTNKKGGNADSVATRRGGVLDWEKVQKRVIKSTLFLTQKSKSANQKGGPPRKKEGVLFLEKVHKKTIEEYSFPYSETTKKALIQKGKQRKKGGGTISGIVAENSNQKYPFSLLGGR